ncbi:MAG: hypothetical protein IJ168_01355 [Eubacterium sp.]|nr:hypothetical protein [Eubacterium sp.]
MLKKVISILLVLAIALAFAACGNANNNTVEQAASAAPTSAAPENTSTTEETTTNGKTLIVYFTVAENTEADAVSSATPMLDGKGAVRVLADAVQAKTNGDMFPLITETKYASDFDTTADTAKNEVDNNIHPKLTEHIANIEEYDTVFIGYSAWWYDMPMAVYSFLDEYDLLGKTVYVFAAHRGSGFAGGIDAIKKEEPQATVIDNGFSINSDDIDSNTSSDIDAWLSELGY